MADSLILDYYYGEDCGVCAADRPRIQAIAAEYNLPLQEKYIGDFLAEASQQLIFTIPAVVLRRDGKEVHRQVRIIDFYRLIQAIEKERRHDLDD